MVLCSRFLSVRPATKSDFAGGRCRRQRAKTEVQVHRRLQDVLHSYRLPATDFATPCGGLSLLLVVHLPPPWQVLLTSVGNVQIYGFFKGVPASVDPQICGAKRAFSIHGYLKLRGILRFEGF